MSRAIFPILETDEMTQLGLSTPIRQGQTRYQYLVMQFAREEETTAEINMAECVDVHPSCALLSETNP